MENKKVVVGLSGGVDSSVTAYLLKKQGFEVIGVTMQIWQEKDDEYSQITAVKDAKKVADALGIDHLVLNFKKDFEKTVIDYFVSEYEHGRTPNPCNVCNRYIKWEALLNAARKLGAKYIATGHYAKILKLENGRYAIGRSEFDKKDQTYALFKLTQDQLAHTIMPLGDYSKDQIREIAASIGLEVATKADSQDICFIPDGNYQKFLEEYTGKKAKPGNFIDKEGKVIGKHQGITAYTIGQRKGLGIAMGHPVFVTEIRAKSDEVVIGENEDLFYRGLTASDINFMAVEAINEPIRCRAKIRYAHKASACTAVVKDGILHVLFDEPQRAITPGQVVVLYDDEKILAGAFIDGVENI